MASCSSTKSNIPISSRVKHTDKHDSLHSNVVTSSASGNVLLSSASGLRTDLHSSSRSLTQQSSKKNLWKEKTRLEAEVQRQEASCVQLQNELAATKERLAQLETESDMIQSESKENIENADKRSQRLESKLETFEKKLLTCNIDPVSLQKLDTTLDEKDEINKKASLAEGKAKVLRDTLIAITESSAKRVQVLQSEAGTVDEISERLQTAYTVIQRADS